MNFEKVFCSSPWIHTRITNSGDYEYCRWMIRPQDHPSADNIQHTHPIIWFQKGMANIRRSMLDGKALDGCDSCYRMETHGKVSGRQKQLLKTGVTIRDFQKTMLSSPWIDEWKLTQACHGETDLHVQDWQIDLGNFCNNACLFCSPESSSRLATEYLKIGMIKSMPPPAWCDDPALLQRFIEALTNSPHIQYLHFIGGETVITPAFRTILEALIKIDLNKNLTLGFTTNLTVMDDDVVGLLEKFYHVNLGVSVECLDPVNDYIRYGSDLTKTQNLLDRWVSIAKRNQWSIQIRTTPTVLSISRLDSIYEYAWNNDAGVESCNFIENPSFMRPSVLPMEYRRAARDRLQMWIDSKQTIISNEQIVNTRHAKFLKQQILQDAQSYVHYLDLEPDQSYLLPELIHYLKLMEDNRKNCVLDYLPEYEKLFRSTGY